MGCILGRELPGNLGLGSPKIRLLILWLRVLVAFHLLPWRLTFDRFFMGLDCEQALDLFLRSLVLVVDGLNLLLGDHVYKRCLLPKFLARMFLLLALVASLSALHLSCPSPFLLLDQLRPATGLLSQVCWLLRQPNGGPSKAAE